MRDIESNLRAKMHDQLDELRMPDRLPSIRHRARRQRVLFATGASLLVVALAIVGARGLNALSWPYGEESAVNRTPEPSDTAHFARFNITYSGGSTDATHVVEINSETRSACYDADIMGATSGHLHRDGRTSPVVTFKPYKPSLCVGDQDADILQDIIDNPDVYYIEFHNSSSGGTLTARLEPGNEGLSNLPGEILFAAFDEGGSTDSTLSTMKPDGTNRTIILEGSGFGHQLERPSWSPDRRKVAFNVYLPDGDGTSDFLNSEIVVMNADGTERQRLTHDSEPVVGPVWSPDGTQFVFARADDERSWELWAMNADGSDQELLTDGSTAGDAGWSPDGRRIVFSQFLYRNGERDLFNQELFVMDIASRTVTRITDTPARESHPAWSPDGSHIAFISEEGRKGSGLYVMNANDSVPTELVPQGVSSISGLAWSPDGSRIAFVKTNRWSNPPTDQDQDQIAVVSAKGADLQTIGPDHHMILGIDWR